MAETSTTTLYVQPYRDRGDYAVTIINWIAGDTRHEVQVAVSPTGRSVQVHVDGAPYTAENTGVSGLAILGVGLSLAAVLVAAVCFATDAIGPRRKKQQIPKRAEPVELVRCSGRSELWRMSDGSLGCECGYACLAACEPCEFDEVRKWPDWPNGCPQ